MHMPAWGKSMLKYCSRSFTRVLCALSLLALFGVAPCWGQSGSTQIPVQTFFGGAKYIEPKLSPDAKTLAALTFARGRYNLVTIDLVSRKATVLTGFEDYDITDY